MVKILGRSSGVTGVLLKHGPSGALLKTAAPVDNGGDGSSFSPTDLCAGSLGACACTIMTMKARALGIEAQIFFSVEKSMMSQPRRISRLCTHFWIVVPDHVPAETFEKIVTAGKQCPVKFSLGSDLEVLETYERGTPPFEHSF